ncbi:MAG: hypothetical protein K0U86_11270 [Planctomycetes bacterium]|nr:hypothetical protein [Planctomycetota bacterium]MCH9725462.1 hypothetical protein [Planctomycetota bacterium]MCH9776559.1 hypothetical protein [Planctomycetota bacterium]MCH9789937.1 hypothetical protein [Planctomycetota bacterium]MDF1747047.1 hypothetical protein [Gimesia sp.]
MYAWMTIWTIMLIASGLAFLVVLAYVAFGVKAELIETLNDLKADVDESVAHEEILDQPIE